MMPEGENGFALWMIIENNDAEPYQIRRNK